MEDLVSIIMPTYNCEKYIADSIETVIKQTYKNWELIIVDDYSTDDTKTIVENYTKQYPNIIYKILEKKSGAAIARNTAIRIAKGKYIAFLDSDDLWKEDKLRKQVEFMKKNKYAFTYTNYTKIDEEGNDLNIQVTGPKKIGKSGMYNYCWLGCLTVMYDSEQVGLIQIENLKKNNDYAIWLKVIEKSKCYLLNENFAKYRIRSNSISNHKKINLIKYHYLLFKDGEKKNAILAFIYTIRNLFFGVVKKVVYERKI